MPLANKLRRFRSLIEHRQECLEYLNSPKRKAALDLIRDPNRPANITVDSGTTTECERAFLREIVLESAAAPGPIVEIGTLFGFTTIELALHKAPERSLLTVDCFAWNPWGLAPTEHRRLTEQLLRVAIATLNVQMVVSDKNEFYGNYSGLAPSMVFLDAIHSYEETRKDIDWARRAGCRHIAGHDYSTEFPEVQRAVNEAGTPEVRDRVWLIRL